MLVLGIDEAGRGAVVGPLVIAGALIDDKHEPELRRIGVRDSKLLTPKKREFLFDKIKALCKDFVILKITAEEIDLTRKRINLNLIEAEHMVKIMKKLKADKVIVDAPQASTEKFKNILLGMLKADANIVSENKADVKYPICSAASILAKVERDAEIYNIKKEVGFDFGVGYPHDARTIAFVKAAIDHPVFSKYIRHSWITTEEIKSKRKQKSLGDFK